MKVVITGTSNGIGRETALKFITAGHYVIGIDTAESEIESNLYSHIIHDVVDRHNLPEIDEVDILINNAGVQNSGRDIEVNLNGVINVTEAYGLQERIKAIVNVASTSAHNGAEFPEYAASKGGVLAYTKYVAMEVAKYGATCNSISPGGVVNQLNKHIIEDDEMFEKVLQETLLHKWSSNSEIAEWIYFIAVINKSMTGQDVIVDNGELSKYNFIW